MTNVLKMTQPTDPEGSIFLPKGSELTLHELDKMKFAVMQLRGPGSELTLEDQERVYSEILALEGYIRERDCELGGVALSHAI